MGLFSIGKSNDDPKSDLSEDTVESVAAAFAPPREEDDEVEVRSAHVISPLMVTMQEKQRQLDSLKAKVSSMNRAMQQMETLASESCSSIGQLADYIDSSKVDVETEIRLKSDNAKLSTDILDLTHKLEDVTTLKEESEAQVHSLRQRASETRASLEEARNEIADLKDVNRQLLDEQRMQNEKIIHVTDNLAEMNDMYSEIKSRKAALESQVESLQAELDGRFKTEAELQQNLFETSKQLEEEVKKNQKTSNDLEALKREFSELRNENVDIKTKLEIAREEVSYHRSRLEDEQRKHDNQVYSLKSDIENLSSQRRIGTQALKEASSEINMSKERNREMTQRLQEAEKRLETSHKAHEADREDLVATSAKLRELNLRYNSALTDLNHEKRQNRKFSENIESLVDENKKLQAMKVKYETSQDQIRELKSLIGNYQLVIKESGEIIDPNNIFDKAEEGGKSSSRGDESLVVQLHESDHLDSPSKRKDH